ncbi:MFS transporter [Sinomonas humi]|uniref:MFS transporter n=1 Tax=Sinomonas humi TaxID=1338436 RepID=UPI000AB6E7C0|nr:MFS transporter [Sinomonas humi]
MRAIRQHEEPSGASALPVPATTRAAQRHTLVVLAVTQIVGTVGVGVAPSIGVLLAGEVTANPAWAGLARTASTLGAALFGLPLGALAARFGRRLALAGGWWAAAGGGALLVIAAQWDQIMCLFVGLLLIGAGSAVSLQARFAATDLAEPHHRARALALVVWVGTIGNVLGPNLGVPAQYMTSATGLTVYAGAFLIAAACLALAGTAVFVWLRPDPLLLLEKTTTTGPRPATARLRGGARRIFAEIRENPQARLAVVAIVTAQIVMVAIMTMAPVHVTNDGGSVTVVGITISLHIAGMYALSPLVGALADRAGHRATIAIGILVLLASLAAGIAEPDQMLWMTVSMILLGVGWSFVNVAGSALFSAVVSPERRASAQGGVDALSNLGGATAAFLAGPLLAATGFSALSAIAIVALLPLIGLLATRNSRAISPR